MKLLKKIYELNTRGITVELSGDSYRHAILTLRTGHNSRVRFLPVGISEDELIDILESDLFFLEGELT